MRVEIALVPEIGLGVTYVSGELTVEKCSGDLTAEGFPWPDDVPLERRQNLVLDAAVELELVPVAAVPLYRGERRIILVDPAWPTS